ncbi:hypothetical protein GOBAR_AA07019 [Gossypium barbadense]|uniref:WAT1-related protein n=1 Tax=Gossypium barbadense TaxID=3634 RepID=A0A2P5YD84_GOSBA|nr:hypothetical protein GOBAR_AA07019 [Gossypium barbadense]
MAGKAKVFGTLTGIGGAMLLTFYKGVEVNIWPTHLELLSHGPPASHPAASSKSLLGLLLAFACCIFTPSGCSFRDWSQWKLGFNIRLLTVAYAGIAVSGLTCTIVIWCVRLKGPLYGSIFNPLMLVLVALAESLLLDAKLYLGGSLSQNLYIASLALTSATFVSAITNLMPVTTLIFTVLLILGAVFIVLLGLYIVLWGKGKEMKDQLSASRNEVPPTISSMQEEPVDIIVDSTDDNICINSQTNVVAP